jgi:hypothetical protein
MGILKVYDRADPGPNGALNVTGDRDPDDPNIERAHTFARVDNPASDPIPVTGAVTVNDVAEDIAIYNVSCVLANTEYSQALSAGTNWILIRARQNSTVKLAFIAGQSGTNFITIPSGASLTLDKMDLTGKTIYFQANVAATDVEILEGS